MSHHILVSLNYGQNRQQYIQKLFQEHDVTINFLKTTPSSKREAVIKQATVLLTFQPERDFKDDEFKLLESLQFIQLTSSGADHFPFRKVPDDITLASNAGAYARPMAEHVMAMTLALAKRLREEHQNMHQGRFNQGNKNISIADSTIGILGFGSVGQAVADLFRVFGVRVFAMNTSGETDQSIDFIGTTDDLEHILRSSDIIVLSMPLNKHTRRLIGKEQLQWMADDTILVNVARGEIIRQKDLYEHLKNHPEFKAGIEAWWVEPARHL